MVGSLYFNHIVYLLILLCRLSQYMQKCGRIIPQMQGQVFFVLNPNQQFFLNICEAVMQSVQIPSVPVRDSRKLCQDSMQHFPVLNQLTVYYTNVHVQSSPYKSSKDS